MRWLVGSKLGRYVGRVMLVSSLLALIILLGVDALFEFLAQLDELDRRYRLPQAATYVVMRIPERAPLFLPFAALFGALGGFSMLDGRGEIRALQAAGLYRWQLIWMSVKPLLVVAALMAACGEYPLPEMRRLSQEYREARLGERPMRSLWHSAKAGEYLYLGDVSADGIKLRDVALLRANEAKLPLALRAAAADYDRGIKRWRLRSVQGDALGLGCRREEDWVSCDFGLSPEFLRLMMTSPEHLSLSALWRYAEALESIGGADGRHRQSFWSEVLSPLNTAALLALALAFAIGPLRGMGGLARIGVGVAIGFGFYFARDMISAAGLLLGVAAPAAALLPPLACLIMTAAALRRI